MTECDKCVVDLGENWNENEAEVFCTLHKCEVVSHQKRKATAATGASPHKLESYLEDSCEPDCLLSPSVV